MVRTYPTRQVSASHPFDQDQALQGRQATNSLRTEHLCCPASRPVDRGIAMSAISRTLIRLGPADDKVKILVNGKLYEVRRNLHQMKYAATSLVTE
jgi:hypothetical protein